MVFVSEKMRKISNSELNRISKEAYKTSSKLPIVVLLDNVRSLNNIGSAFRTADAFLIEAVYLCGITACPPHAEINKTALGAQNTVSWNYYKTASEAVFELKQKGYRVCAVEQAEHKVYLQDFIPTINEPLALVFGNEVKGVDDAVMQIVDTCIEIPQFGTKHSLNISVSIGVVLWDICSKLRK